VTVLSFGAKPDEYRLSLPINEWHQLNLSRSLVWVLLVNTDTVSPNGYFGLVNQCFQHPVEAFGDLQRMGSDLDRYPFLVVYVAPCIRYGDVMLRIVDSCVQEGLVFDHGRCRWL
jgi:hypothetical protein